MPVKTMQKSQETCETQRQSASHPGCETHAKPASHIGDENQADHASRPVGETQNPGASHRPDEAQISPASPRGVLLKKVRTRTPEQDAFLKTVRQYQAFQKMRVSLSNQIKAMTRQELISKEQEDEFVADLVKPWVKIHDQVITAAAKQLKGVPIYEGWLKHVRGIGPKLAVQFIALIQPIGDFPNVAKLWAYAGYAVGDDGRAVRRQAGKQSRWNPDLKKLGFQAGDCWIKLKRTDKETGELLDDGGPFRVLFDRYKLKDRAAHPEKMPLLNKAGKQEVDRSGKLRWKYNDAHINNRARRYAIKIFLALLWQAWREMEGLPTPGPYAVEHLDHTTVMSPWSFVGIEEPKTR